MSGFFAALWIGWVVLGAAGFYYASLKQIPVLTATPIILAYLIEYTFYLVPGIDGVQKRLRLRYSKIKLASAASVTAIAPYLIYSVATRQFRWISLGVLVVLVSLLCFWYIALRAAPIVDIAFLCVAAGIVLSHVLDTVYTSPIPQQIDSLGKLMLIRTAAFAMLAIRMVENPGYSFIPRTKDWRIGAENFLFFLPLGFGLAYWLGLVHLTTAAISVWKILGVFFGALWVLALSEEFVFRGLLQRWLEKWTGNAHVALGGAAIVFGLCHLPFRGFPNWKMALVATIAGVFYGRARNQAGSIQAGMIAHALVVTVWRNFFTW